eukprot:2727090-Pyramimonas_sp.AAC.1
MKSPTAPPPDSAELPPAAPSSFYLRWLSPRARGSPIESSYWILRHLNGARRIGPKLASKSQIGQESKLLNWPSQTCCWHITGQTCCWHITDPSRERRSMTSETAGLEGE